MASTIHDLERASLRIRSVLDHNPAACRQTRDSLLESRTSENNTDFYSLIGNGWSKFIIHKAKNEKAQLTINAIRNPRSVTTINSLPPELLIRIFSLLVKSRPCLIPRYSPTLYTWNKKSFIQYPDSLSHVCSSWRSLVIGLPYFWSHVDIILSHPLNSGLLARAEVFATRASAAPLEVHLCDPDLSARQDWGGFPPFRSGQSPSGIPVESKSGTSAMDYFEFLNSVPAQIESLNIHLTSRLQSHHKSALRYLLARCTPGIFNKFSMKYGEYGNPMYCIESTDNPQTPGNILLSIPSQQLEQIWLCTTTLRLDGIYPPWSSQAYHGLVELHLGGGIGFRIPESSLVRILRSSPGLRFLYLRIDLDNPLPLESSVEPVHLDELVELDIMGEDPPGHSDKILRWIAPGSKPLQFNFVGIPSSMAVPFCARSNITRFYGEDFVSRWKTVVDMIRQSPRLEVLALNARRFKDGNELVSNLGSIPLDQGDRDPVSLSTEVNTLYLLNFAELPFENLYAVIRKCAIQRLMLRNTSIAYETGEGQAICCQREVETRLSTCEHLVVVDHLAGRCSFDLERWQ
ncbi:unnamed protein product [Rhizoctonia solani]|uniref:F-box-like domain protein n=1 Tax=Rhizoctonia solani TaxID=456999 RepID=A0A8H3DQF0_9AGAM|nr:unnamed protein product [Rhizoctonia solani]